MAAVVCLTACESTNFRLKLFSFFPVVNARIADDPFGEVSRMKVHIPLCVSHCFMLSNGSAYTEL